MSLRPRPVDRVHRNRPSGVRAPPVGKFPSLVSLPTGSSLRPVGWIRVFGPTMFDPPPAPSASPAHAQTPATVAGIHADLPRMAAILSPAVATCGGGG